MNIKDNLSKLVLHDRIEELEKEVAAAENDATSSTNGEIQLGSRVITTRKRCELETCRLALRGIDAVYEIERLAAENARLSSALAEAREVITRSEKALSRITTDVFNDNGDITWCRPSLSQEDIELAYWTKRSLVRWLERNP